MTTIHKKDKTMTLQDKKEEFIALFEKYIKRDGAEELLNFLNHSDFFSAPASTRFHSNVAGGLCAHSLNVYYRFLKYVKSEYGDNYTDFISDESIAIVALLHDICKVNYYTIEMRNVKENGTWVQKPYYSVTDTLPYGHGEKSVYIISGFMKLTREEAMMINWHMGGFDERVKGGSYGIRGAFELYPNAVLFHIADLSASYLDEETVK